MPICNEDVDRIFRGVEAILDLIAGNRCRSKVRLLHSERFHEGPEFAALELACWRALSAGGTPARSRVYYRNRAENIGRKSGNISESAKIGCA